MSSPPIPSPGCYEVSDVAQKLNNQFLALKDTYFTYETQFDMGNGTVFHRLPADCSRHPGRGRRLSVRLRRRGRPSSPNCTARSSTTGAAKRGCEVKFSKALAQFFVQVYT